MPRLRPGSPDAAPHDPAAAYVAGPRDEARERRWKKLKDQPKMMELGLLGGLIAALQPSTRHLIDASAREEALKADDLENAGPGTLPDYSRATIRLPRIDGDS